MKPDDTAEYDWPVVCISHGRFIPCRETGRGAHWLTSNAFWVKSVADHQQSHYDYPWLAPRTDEIAAEWWVVDVP